MQSSNRNSVGVKSKNMVLVVSEIVKFVFSMTDVTKESVYYLELCTELSRCLCEVLIVCHCSCVYAHYNNGPGDTVYTTFKNTLHATELNIG